MKTHQNDFYTYRVSWAEEDEEYVGLCAEFPSLSWLAGTPEAAMRGIRKLVAQTLVDMARGDEELPKPLAWRQYSGKFVSRVSTRGSRSRREPQSIGERKIEPVVGCGY